MRIFTVSAHWVRTLDAPGGSVTWDLKNDSGEGVASGYYIYLITNSSAAKAAWHVRYHSLNQSVFDESQEGWV